ncbi:MAG: DNA-directed RNA polymerase subunit alpha [Patescibacteria group bacterium]
MEIKLPAQIKSKELETNHSEVTISSCYPGYGTTLGNALRRVLLSSLPGAAATAVKIKGVDHEFSTINGVKEDVIEIILNIKQLRFKVYSDEPVEIELKVKGAKIITAGDFTKNSQVEIVNTDQKIATITAKDATLEMKITVQKGRGYVPVEAREKEKMEVGYIAIDAIYTPIKNVNYHIEHVRVEQMTNYDKLILDIKTDGTITPQAAVSEAAKILVDHFSLVGDAFTVSEEKESKGKK